MTQALSRANWSWTPSFTGLWLEALLRGIAMFWSNVAATFRMIPSRPAREGTRELRRRPQDAMPPPLPLLLLPLPSESRRRLTRPSPENLGPARKRAPCRAVVASVSA
ncbi:MAG: hypothetical protein Q8R02_17080 [Hyphomonadaceae bacterium]|nr:hypothetical protein [Hyphomonadaceae bacterium]